MVTVIITTRNSKTLPVLLHLVFSVTLQGGFYYFSWLLRNIKAGND